MLSGSTKNRLRKILLLSFITILILGFGGSAMAFYGPPPTWSQALSFGYGGYPYHASFSGYETYSNPYMYGPMIGAYPYNAMFNVYSGGYNMNMGYNQNLMGFYSSADFYGTGQRNVNAFGYPLPYAYVDQGAYANQVNYAYGGPGQPPMGGSYITSANPFNIYYNPQAFTTDLGIDAYFTGINNFWTNIFQDLNEEEED